MHVLFLTRYTKRGASSRYRVHQYLPSLAAAGHTYTVQPFFDDVYFSLLYGTQGGRVARRAAKITQSLKAFYRRITTLLQSRQRYDAVYLEYEALPYLPYALESALLSRGVRTIVDYDDAVYMNYTEKASSLVRLINGDKLAQLVTHCTHIIVANRTLSDWAQQYNPHVTIIPTVVDLQRYPLCRPPIDPQAPFTIVWIGTPVTIEYLSLVNQALRRLAQRHKILLKVIGAPGYQMTGVPTVALPWSYDTEVAELQSAHGGIMPLVDDQWARGKSALKLLQYMAAGIAAVASPVGANCDVIQSGVNGLLAADDLEWESQLRLLIENPALRVDLAAAGRRTVESTFSLEANTPRWLATVTGSA